jgi:iron complex outermembrane receptor protein
MNPANYVLAGTTPLSQCYMILPGYNTNEDKARSWGGEISTEWHPLSWWKVQASYSHLRVKGTRTGDLLGDMQVQVFEKSAPRHQAMLVNSVSLTPDLNLNVRLRYNTSTQHYVLNKTDMVEVPAYTGLDVRLGWQFNRYTELSLMGRNLLKDRHTEFINVLPFTRAYDIQRSVLAQAVFRF